MATQLTDPKGRPIVVVTGMGIVTSLGRGKADNWAALTAGRSGIKPIRRFPIEGLRTTIAGTIDCMGVTDYSAYELSYAIAEAASLEAVTQSGIASAANFPGPLFIATPPSELEWPALRRLYDDAPVDSGTGYQRLLAAARTRRYGDLARHAEFASIADRMQVKFGTRGEPISICTACASGATTIQMGVEAIRRGEATAALCVGADATVHPEGLIRFSLLSALSTRNSEPEKASRPFASDRDGFVIAEGAGAVVLEVIRVRFGARRCHSRRCPWLRREGRRLPPHALSPRRLRNHRCHAQDTRRCLHVPGRDRLHQRTRHQHARK